MKRSAVDVEQAKDKEYLFKRYGSILGTRVLPISVFGIRYFEKNYGKILRPIPENSRILEIGPGNASFTQYLLYKGYRNITVCEMADDNARSLDYFFGDRIRVVRRDAIDYLESSSDGFDFIYAAQLIEHFAYDDFVKFLQHCYVCLNEGGYIVFETINCANITHGLYLRYCDYTHRIGFTPRSLKHFLMAVGDFSELKLIEIHPQGFLDCLKLTLHYRRTKGISTVLEIKQSADLTDSYRSSDPSSVHRGLRRLMLILLRELSIRFSRWLSFFFLRPYEFEKIKVYTPFFAIVARKT